MYPPAPYPAPAPSPFDASAASEARDTVAPWQVPHDARDPATPMELHEKSRLRAAAFRAKRRYPGPVGEVLSREILDWHEFGFRVSNGGLIMQLVEHIMKEPTP